MGYGDYMRYVSHPEDPFDARVRAFRDDTVDSLPNKFENWDKEHVREAVEGLMREDQKQQDRITTGQNADAFLAVHPEFLDTQANGELMNHESKRMFGEGAYTVAHYEQAYQSLRSSNFLALNKTEVAKQEKAAAKQHAEAERARVSLSEDELYAMDMDELRMRATGVWNK